MATKGNAHLVPVRGEEYSMTRVPTLSSELIHTPLESGPRCLISSRLSSSCWRQVAGSLRGPGVRSGLWSRLKIQLIPHMFFEDRRRRDIRDKSLKHPSMPWYCGLLSAVSIHDDVLILPEGKSVLQISFVHTTILLNTHKLHHHK